MPKLADFIGQIITVKLRDPFLKDDPEKHDIAHLKLVDVESFGIWVESDKFTMECLQGRATLPITPIFFVPFSQISLIVDAADYPSFSEAAFGL